MADYTPLQRLGSEYGGVDGSNGYRGTIQPKGKETLKPSDLLGLGYQTDGETAYSLQDHRAMLGLSTENHPMWIDNVSDDEAPEKLSEARRQGFNEEGTDPWR